MMSRPPIFAEGLLRLLLAPGTREPISGDLLEEYRESRLPALGRVRADVWYVRQVIVLFFRVYGWFLVPIVLLLVVHDLFNTFRDATGASYLDGASALARVPLTPLATLTGAASFVAAAAYGTWLTRRYEGGLVAALGLFVVTWLFMVVYWNVTFYPFAQVQQHNPYWIQAWQWSTHRAGSHEGFLRWIFWDNVGGLFFMGLTLAAVSSVCGLIGSTMALACGAGRTPSVTR